MSLLSNLKAGLVFRILPGWPLFMVSAITAGNWLLVPWIGSNAILLIYFLAILILAQYLNRTAIILVACLCALMWNFLFLAPLYTLHIDHPTDFVTFVLFLIVAVIAGNLTTRLRQLVQAAREGEERLTFLFQFSTRMNQIIDPASIIDLAENVLRQISGGAATILLGDFAETQLRNTSDEMERAAAEAARVSGQPAGKGTARFTTLDVLYIPLPTKVGPGGMAVVSFPAGARLDDEKKSLLHTLIEQVAVILDREALLRLTQEARTNQEIDRLYRALLDLITHEIRTPIAVIKGSLSSLDTGILKKKPAEARQLLHNAEAAAGRLGRLVDNLIDMSRLESGRLKLNLDWYDPAEIIRTATRPLAFEFPAQPAPELFVDHSLLLRLDFILMEKVFYNLFRNAYLHNPDREDVHVKITVAERDGTLRIVVTDDGRGLSPEMEKNLFVKFARGDESVQGAGLGLSVVKGVLELHGATIHYEHDRGTRFVIQFRITPENSRPFALHAPRAAPGAGRRGGRTRATTQV